MSCSPVWSTVGTLHCPQNIRVWGGASDCFLHDFILLTLPLLCVYVLWWECSILWDAMHNRTHPVGATYAEVYAFLNW